jgi:glycosyltransferase involved in cell wall biosynthesis
MTSSDEMNLNREPGFRFISSAPTTVTKVRAEPSRERTAADTEPIGALTGLPCDGGSLTVVDVALHAGPGYDGLATYLQAKQRYAESSGRLEHHAIVPAGRELHFAGWHELPASGQSVLSFKGRNAAMRRLLHELAPDVIVLHGPFETAQHVVRAAQATDARIIAVSHHQEPPAPNTVVRAMARWRVHGREALALRGIDAPITPLPAGVPAQPGALIRLGIDPEFAATASARRGREVVFAGELGYGTSVPALLLAANAASTVWPIRIIGRGPRTRSLKRAIRMLGLSHRVELEPFTTDRRQLASIFAGAGCVVNPGDPSRCQLTLLEAAGTGTPIVAPASAPINAVAPELTHSYPTRSIDALAKAIDEALRAPANPVAGREVLTTNSWQRAFEQELDALHELAHR